jgi:hypothetical protein
MPHRFCIVATKAAPAVASGQFSRRRAHGDWASQGVKVPIVGSASSDKNFMFLDDRCREQELFQTGLRAL